MNDKHYKSMYHILKCENSYDYERKLYLISSSLSYLGANVPEDVRDILNFIDVCITKEHLSISKKNYTKIKKELFDEKNS